MKSKNIAIVGAGLAGSLLAIYLARRGFRIDIYEGRPDMRRKDISAGRSINLALSTRGIHALREVGVLDDIMRDAIPMRGRMMHSLAGELAFQAYGKSECEVINSVSRAGLNSRLMDAAEATGRVRIFFDMRCIDVDLVGSELLFRDQHTGSERRVSPAVILACDGAFSAVRWEMMKSGRFNFSETYLAHGYKELTVPPTQPGSFRMAQHALHIWPRGSYMLIALPNPDGSFTCTLFMPFEGQNSFAKLDRPENVQSFFEKEFPDTIALMPQLTTEFFQNPTGSLVTIRCFPWHVNERALLLGDAAHAIVPFYGQGMNCAFEDCTVLNACIGEHGDNWSAAFADFQTRRKPNADAIAQLAQDNFIEMRDKVADPDFLMKKKLEIKLESEYPQAFLSTYARVTFHRGPYAEALRRGAVQDRILMSACTAANALEDINLPEIMSQILSAE